MRWFVRLGLVGSCLALWIYLLYFASALSAGISAVPKGETFCFPDFLPGGDIYVWSMTHDAEDNAVLLVQNISSCALKNVKIQFWADGIELCFETECILSGQRAYIAEKHKTVFAQWHTVLYRSYTAEETEIASLADKEDYSCKK